MSPNKVKELILEATGELHRKSSEAADDQWFRRAEIARQLAAPSSRLNAARIGALEQLVDTGRMLKRQKPNDLRDLPQYRLA